MRIEAKVYTFLGVSLVVLFFGLSIFFSYAYFDEIKGLIGNSFLGMSVYAFVIFMQVIVAPLNVAPLIPLAVKFWGLWLTFLITLVAEVCGAFLAFWIARKWGRPLVERLTSAKELYEYEKFVPERRITLAIIILKLALPLDILSYLMGLSERIQWRHYIPGTIIGTAPYIFLLSYLGELPWSYFFGVLIAGMFAFSILLMIGKHRRKKVRKKFHHWYKRRFRKRRKTRPRRK